MRFGSLFAGIGGFDLGLERAGMECAWQVEIDPFCRKVLEKHWPNVKRYEDVREIGRHNLEPIDLVCGGFPCQDIAREGRGLGLAGTRSGLWSEYARIVRELRPEIVVVENVAALLERGMGAVLGDLAQIGYDAEWQIIPCQTFGAPHSRERVFIVAHAAGGGLAGNPVYAGTAKESLRAANEEWLRRQTGDAGGGAWKTMVGTRERIRLLPDPEIFRSDDGIPDWMDRLKSVGNAVMPHIAEWIGRRILGVYGE